MCSGSSQWVWRWNNKRNECSGSDEEESGDGSAAACAWLCGCVSGSETEHNNQFVGIHHAFPQDVGAAWKVLMV